MNFFIGMWPAIIDFATGNWQRFDDNAISVKLVPGEAPPPYGLQPSVPQLQQPPQ